MGQDTKTYTKKTPMTNPTVTRIRQADSGDTAAVLELYRQLVRPVAPDVEVDVRAERIEEIRADLHNFLWVLEAEDHLAFRWHCVSHALSRIRCMWPAALCRSREFYYRRKLSR